MSRQTNIELRKLFIYQVYIRNHTEEGTFKAFQKDLDRIENLGVDIVYFLPIHPIGEVQRKGALGSPYSIQDYRKINPEYGTLEDFKALVNEIHQRGMKVMIDVVYNHTSYDSKLLNEFPEYFYKEHGEFKNRVGDWWDITDLDYSTSHRLWEELIDTLLYWTTLGVDGFRWDVASLLPMEFLEEAHDKVLSVNPESIFLSESVHGEFLRHIRNRGFLGLSESEIYQVFDIAYDYDTHPLFEGYLNGDNTLKTYLTSILKQEEQYPQNYIKLRNLENHDFGRFADMVDSNHVKIDNWSAFVFFNKGCTMIYAGQERSDTNLPSLFDKDPVHWDGYDVSSDIKTLASLVKDDIFTKGVYNFEYQDHDVIVATYQLHQRLVVGIFNVGDETGKITCSTVPNGVYQNLLDHSEITVSNQTVAITKKPIIFEVTL
ncbi:MAG: alpha-amylase family glycosyl hydrolase [Candidatus Izemoplasma sp.]|nr:alpha-amylase family glycosyl hydrolase [Candidatus Izemoplasma sp.]